MRSTFFGLILASRLPELSGKLDREIQACAAMMHDLAWNPMLEKTKGFVSADKRFEVDGAIVAVKFLEGLPPAGKDAGWNARKKQLVWDAIALHSTMTIAWYKEPEVMLTSYGIMIDFAGPDAPVFPQGAGLMVTKQEYDAVVERFPRLDLIGYVKEAFCGLCRVKPGTTYDNLVGDYGDEFLKDKGFGRNGNRVVDFAMAQRETLEGVRIDAPYTASPRA